MKSDWRERLRLLMLAGGTLSAASCNPFTSIPCGNANPDPCICGRPDDDPSAAKECTAKKGCEAKGGVWIGYTVTLPDAGIVEPHCEEDGGSPDTSPKSDAAAD